LKVEYFPGKDNIVADAMSRFAYPASSSREDVCFHGSAESHAEVTKMIQKEREEGRMVGLLRLGHTHTSGDLVHGFHTRSRIGAIYIADPFPTNFPISRRVNVTTRSGVVAKGEDSDASSSQDEDASLSSPPPATRTRSRTNPLHTSVPLPQEAGILPPQSSRSTRGRKLLPEAGDPISILPASNSSPAILETQVLSEQGSIPATPQS
jgi:hypothetical protein